MLFIAAFFAGAFLCNAIPHLAAGLQGQSFPTPFAKPRGIGNSPPLLNFLWGALNTALGGYLLAIALEGLSDVAAWILVGLGALALGTHLSLHFGRVRSG